VRGAEGMLGIVTAIEFDLVQQPRFYGGSLWFDGTDLPGVIDAWRAWSAELREEGTTSFALFQLPDMEGVPPDARRPPDTVGALRVDGRPRGV
jgi:hypothetical protein